MCPQCPVDYLWQHEVHLTMCPQCPVGICGTVPQCSFGICGTVSSRSKMDGLVFKKRSRDTWTTECERCTGQQQKIKTKRKRFCMKCDRPSDDLKCYLIREGLKFVWQPKLRFHGHVYFEQNLQKISMPGLIYHKNELLKRLKSCKIMCTEHGKVTMFMCRKKKTWLSPCKSNMEG